MVKMFAAAAAVVLLTPVSVFAEAMPFGAVHAYLGGQTEQDADLDYRFNDGHLRLGVKGADYLSDDYQTSFILEGSLTANEQGGRTEEVRQAWLGVSGNFGEWRMGRHLSPGRVSIEPVDLFPHQHGRLNQLLTAEQHDDGSLVYINRVPDFEALGYAVALSGSRLDSDVAIDTLFNYTTKPIYAAVAYRNDRRNDTETLRLAARYQQDNGLRAGVAAEYLRDATDSGQRGHRALMVNAGYQVGQVLLKTQFGWNNPTASGETEQLGALGADYLFNDKMTLQLEYARHRYRNHLADNDETVVSLGFSYYF